MENVIFFRKIKYEVAGVLVCGLLLGTGCGRDHAQRDAAEETHPQVREGLEQVHLKNWEAAIRQFEAALAEDPAMARPDLELALIYHQRKTDYIRAAYHYQRYLEKRPETEKRPMIREWIRQAKLSIAAEAGSQAGDISDDLVRLKRENNMLRKQIETFQDKTADTASDSVAPPEPKPAVSTAPEPETTPVASRPVQRIRTPAPSVRIYKVRPGDTLTRIARDLYGDAAKWRDIYNANRDKMDNENDLQVGQSLVIP